MKARWSYNLSHIMMEVPSYHLCMFFWLEAHYMQWKAMVQGNGLPEAHYQGSLRAVEGNDAREWVTRRRGHWGYLRVCLPHPSLQRQGSLTTWSHSGDCRVQRDSFEKVRWRGWYFEESDLVSEKKMEGVLYL